MDPETKQFILKLAHWFRVGRFTIDDADKIFSNVPFVSVSERPLVLSLAAAVANSGEVLSALKPGQTLEEGFIEQVGPTTAMMLQSAFGPDANVRAIAEKKIQTGENDWITVSTSVGWNATREEVITTLGAQLAGKEYVQDEEFYDWIEEEFTIF